MLSYWLYVFSSGIVSRLIMEEEVEGKETVILDKDIRKSLANLGDILRSK